ncbi:MAG: cyclodeaminase/cyclohydrolase family protein [Spirochaetes bacterium]|nr:cyclodeaminase/cyclohydrolase family protein [Spirochaetota bacterium]
MDELSSASPAPGGGSVAALCASLAAALTSMVANLTYKKKNDKKLNNILKELSNEAQFLKEECLKLIDQDAQAFQKYLNTLKPLKSTKQQLKQELLEQAAEQMILVPYSILKKCEQIILLAEKVCKKGNKLAISDGAISSLTAATAAESAFLNIKINFPMIENTTFQPEMLKEAENILLNIKKINKRNLKFAYKILG